jgi:hypothetical protein
VVADAGGGGWLEQMTRDLRACRTPQERNAWEQKWGGYLSGQAQRDIRPPRSGGARAMDSVTIRLHRRGACFIVHRTIFLDFIVRRT